jgi:hypothetical protein
MVLSPIIIIIIIIITMLPPCHLLFIPSLGFMHALSPCHSIIAFLLVTYLPVSLLLFPSPSVIDTASSWSPCGPLFIPALLTVAVGGAGVVMVAIMVLGVAC